MVGLPVGRRVPDGGNVGLAVVGLPAGGRVVLWLDFQLVEG